MSSNGSRRVIRLDKVTPASSQKSNPCAHASSGAQRPRPIPITRKPCCLNRRATARPRNPYPPVMSTELSIAVESPHILSQRPHDLVDLSDLVAGQVMHRKMPDLL